MCFRVLAFSFSLTCANFRRNLETPDTCCLVAPRHRPVRPARGGANTKVSREWRSQATCFYAPMTSGITLLLPGTCMSMCERGRAWWVSYPPPEFPWKQIVGFLFPGEERRHRNEETLCYSVYLRFRWKSSSWFPQRRLYNIYVILHIQKQVNINQLTKSLDTLS